MYHNTTNSAEKELHAFRIKAEYQDDIVLSYYLKAKVLSPSEVEVLANQDGYSWPLTSIRRTLNTLTRKGFLEKTTMKREGSFGRNECIWEMKEQ